MMGLYFLWTLAVSAVLLCTPEAGGYVYQMISDCEYGDDPEDMVFFVKNVFNQKLVTMYDSRVGKYVGFGEYVPPIVKVHQAKSADYGERSMLECRLLGFYPQEVRVSWLRDGVEVTTDVLSTDVMSNGDWSFQLHSYLELTLKRGERVTCRVDHSSLWESMYVDFDTSALEAKHLKKTVGIIFFCIGFTVAAAGAAYYRWKQRFDFTPLVRGGQTPPRQLPEF